MRKKSIGPAVLAVVLSTAAAIFGLAAASTAWATGGQTTPGVTVTAQNPGTSMAGTPLRITMTAHSEPGSVSNPSCRPQDANLACWGNLVLRIPTYGGLTLSGLQVHRVAVGDTSCGDESEDGCSGEMIAALPTGGAGSVNAQVNGLSTMTDPGDSGLPAGTQVQVKIDLTDNGRAQYGDTVDVQINQFVPGAVKPLIYATGAQIIQQVQIHSNNG